MNSFIEVLLDGRDELFEFFEQVFLFGSAIYTDAPNDIDILLVYREDRLEELILQRATLSIALTQRCESYIFHLTILNEAELQETNFLVRVRHIRVK